MLVLKCVPQLNIDMEENNGFNFFHYANKLILHIVWSAQIMIILVNLRVAFGSLFDAQCKL